MGLLRWQSSWGWPCPPEVGMGHGTCASLLGKRPRLFTGGLMAIYGGNPFNTSEIALGVPVIQHLFTQKRCTDGGDDLELDWHRQYIINTHKCLKKWKRRKKKKAWVNYSSAKTTDCIINFVDIITTKINITLFTTKVINLPGVWKGLWTESTHRSSTLSAQSAPWFEYHSWLQTLQTRFSFLNRVL